MTALVRIFLTLFAGSLACGCAASTPAGCQVGTRTFTADSRFVIRYAGDACTVESVAECTYCIGPVAIGPTQQECEFNTFGTMPCLGPYTGVTR